MASDRGVPGSGVFGDLPPSYTRSQPPAHPDLQRRPSYCHAAFALKQISKVMHFTRSLATHTHALLYVSQKT
uniref:Uncharacterized protein n=1 Tax=Xiphophorus couchianus TaxID=32473 RepID=A0A3B5KYK4_9TELE